MRNTRNVESSIGHTIAMTLDADGNHVRLSRIDVIAADVIVLNTSAARILAAYLGSVTIVGTAKRPDEDVGDEIGTIISAHSIDAPLVRVSQGTKSLDIHAPAWNALRYEIEMVAARMPATGRARA